MLESAVNPWNTDEAFQKQILARPQIAHIVSEAESKLRREYKKGAIVYVYIEPDLTYDEVRVLKEYFLRWTMFHGPRRPWRKVPYLGFHNNSSGGA
jgi:hypothetical protein